MIEIKVDIYLLVQVNVREPQDLWWSINLDPEVHRGNLSLPVTKLRRVISKDFMAGDLVFVWLSGMCRLTRSLLRALKGTLLGSMCKLWHHPPRQEYYQTQSIPYNRTGRLGFEPAHLNKGNRNRDHGNRGIKTIHFVINCPQSVLL